MNKPLLALVLCSALAACRGNAPGALPGVAGEPAVQGSRAMLPSAVVGSSNTVTADMPVPRPDTTPCTVTLFDDFRFKNYTPQTFSFTPPAACPGPWAAVVFNFDAGSTKGIQFDRTGVIWLDGAPIFFGTTAEPTPKLAPHWHVERDVTGLSALFKQSSQGQISLGNCYCKPYNGVLYGTATVQFYPPDAKYPAPRVADRVIGMPLAPPLGNVTQLPQHSPMAIATAMPHNVEAAYLDVYLQSQNEEEQWFMCSPSRVFVPSGKNIGFCPHTAFREGEVSVDGTPAGIAPIYPWIYTGGLDPDLWSPIPGVQTLEFAPYRVDLTPFAAQLSSGKTHTVAVDVYGAFNYFSGTGDLLLFLDPKRAQVTGRVLSNTLGAPQRSVRNGLVYGKGTGLFGDSTASGVISVRSARDFTISGYVDTSRGRITTTIREGASFSNSQTYAYTATGYSQLVKQRTTVRTAVTTDGPSGTSVRTEAIAYPLDVAYPIAQTKTGFQLPLAVYQGYTDTLTVTGAVPFSSTLSNTVSSQDTMIFNKSFSWTNAINGASLQLYTYKDSTGICYGRELQSKQNVLSAASNPGCSAVPPTPRP